MMSDRQFLEFIKMLEAIRLVSRHRVSEKPIVIFNPDMNLSETSTAPPLVQQSDQMAFDAIRFAEQRNAGE